MAFVDFMNFVKQPDRERYAALTLRLRPSVAAGRITPTAARTIEVPAPPVGGDPTRQPMVIAPGPGWRAACSAGRGRGIPGPSCCPRAKR